MGLLDGGLQSVFGAAFGAIYLDGALVSVTLTDDGYGTTTETTTTSAIKGQVDAVTEKMRQAAGYTDGDVRLIVLQSGLGFEPTTDDRVVLGGKYWAVADVEADPAKTHWVMRGSLISTPVPTVSFTSPTTDTTPLISGTATAGAVVSIQYDAGLDPVTVTAGSDGTWAQSLPELEDGEYSIRVRQSFGGISSAWSAAQPLVIDTTGPTDTVITTPSPLATADRTPTIAGTAASDAVAVKVYLDGVEDGEADLSSGVWTYTFDMLDFDTFSVTARGVDALGNVGAVSNTLSLVINEPLSISGTPVTGAVLGAAYAGFTASASGGTLPYTYSLQSGSLPAGITLDASTGVVSGTPTQAGKFTGIIIQVEDAE